MGRIYRKQFCNEGTPVMWGQLLNIFEDIGVPLKDYDVEKIHRLRPRSKKGEPRNIIVQLTSHKAKVELMRNKKKLKTSDRRNQNQIYINEALTPYRAKMFADARKLVKDKKIKNAWTRDGQILIRNNEDTKTFTLQNISDINKL